MELVYLYVNRVDKFAVMSVFVWRTLIKCKPVF